MHMVLLASTDRDLQHPLGQFAIKCKAVGIRVSTSNSEAMILGWKMTDPTPPQVGSELLPQVKKFKYLWVLFMTQGKMEHEINRQISMASAVTQELYQTVVMKMELSQREELLIYQFQLSQMIRSFF